MSNLNAKKRSRWLYIIAAMGIWHLGRGAYGDAAVFILSSVLLELDFRNKKFLFKKFQIVKKEQLILILIASGVVLSIAPRFSNINLFVLGILAFVSFLLIWHPDLGRRPKIDQPTKRAIKYWSVLLVGLCLIELSAYVLATLDDGNDIDFPTVSVLLDPALESVTGRIVFCIIWLLIGYRLMRSQIFKREVPSE